jgi:hypothetical protein
MPRGRKKNSGRVKDALYPDFKGVEIPFEEFYANWAPTVKREARRYSRFNEQLFEEYVGEAWLGLVKMRPQFRSHDGYVMRIIRNQMFNFYSHLYRRQTGISPNNTINIISEVNSGDSYAGMGAISDENGVFAKEHDPSIAIDVHDLIETLTDRQRSDMEAYLNGASSSDLPNYFAAMENLKRRVNWQSRRKPRKPYRKRLNLSELTVGSRKDMWKAVERGWLTEKIHRLLQIPVEEIDAAKRYWWNNKAVPETTLQ